MYTFLVDKYQINMYPCTHSDEAFALLMRCGIGQGFLINRFGQRHPLCPASGNFQLVAKTPTTVSRYIAYCQLYIANEVAAGRPEPAPPWSAIAT